MFKTSVRNHCTLTREEEMGKAECPWALGGDLLLTSSAPSLAETHPRPPEDRGLRDEAPAARAPGV